ncbi:MAG TPA: hypothetical protein VFU02_22085 [Polyangiaceae bacterium]|nr:hypothetical protein [Polyangiaceae bacterium]
MLDATHFFDRDLPEHYAALLPTLAALEALTHGPKETKQDRSRQAEVLYAGLLARAAPASGPSPAEHLPDAPEFQHWFAEAVLLWLSLGKTSSAPLLDTVGARTMQSFPLDAPLDASAATSIERALCHAFGFSAEAFRGLQARLGHATSNLSFKHQLTRALAEYCAEPDRSSERGRVELMRAFYGDVPFVPGEVDVLLTTTSLSFFIPRRGKRLEGPAWDARSPAEQERVRAFLAQLDAGNVAETKRFPTFGYHDPSALDSALLTRLAERTGAPPSVVVDTLVTMYSVIPTRLREQYLVHDTWGHTWQEALHEFEAEYALLPHIDAALKPRTGAEFAEHGPTPGRSMLRDAFVERAGGTELNEVVWRQVVEADLRDRVRVGISCALSEVFADYMESKYSRVRPNDALPTSSLIGSRSLKIDLSIADLRRQLVRAGDPYRRFASDASVRAEFRAALVSEGTVERGLDAALELASRLLEDVYLPLLDTSLVDAEEPASARTMSTLYRRALIQIVLLMAQLERVLAFAEDGVERAWHDPTTCSDLYAIALAHFYELDRGRNFWHLDEIVKESLAPACSRLTRSLATVLAGSSLPDTAPSA